MRFRVALAFAILIALGCGSAQLRGPVMGEVAPVIYVSAIPGIHQNSNLSTGGGTDDTSLIQAVLTAHPSGVILVQDGISLITGLNLGSNTTVRINSGKGFYLANSSNREAFRNLHGEGGPLTNIVDHNITITGTGEINCNAAGQGSQIMSNGSLMVGVGFYGVSNLTISGGLTIYNAQAYVLDIANATNVTVDNVSLLQTTTAFAGGTDSIDLRGPINGAMLSNLTVLSSDDAIALNSISYVGSYGPYNAVGGNIANVTISNVNFEGNYSGIHLYSNTEYASYSVSNIAISNLTGTVQNSVVMLDNDPIDLPGYGGVFSTISVTNSSVGQTGTPYSGSNFPTGERRFVVNGSVDSLTFTNIGNGLVPVVFWTSFGTATSLLSNTVQLGPITGPASPDLLVSGSGAVSRWPFNEGTGTVAHDILSGDNLTEHINGGSWSSLAGVSGGAYNFSNAFWQESVVRTGTDFDYNQPWSVFAVVEPTSTPANAAIFANIQSDSTARGWELITSSGVLTLYFLSNAGTGNYIGISGPTLSINTLYDIVITCDGSHTASGIKLYVNGSLVSKTVLLDALTATTVSTVPLAIGSRPADDSLPWIGYIGPVGVWDSVLTGTQVSTLHSNFYETSF